MAAEPMAVPRFPIRLVALDLDGTLVGDDLVLGPAIRAVVREVLGRGVAVSIVTGRMARSARRFAEELGLRGPLVAYQGALIRDAGTAGSDRPGRLLYHRPLPADVARDAVAWTMARGMAPHVNHLERMILPASDPNAEDYSRFLGARAELVPDLAAWIHRPVTKLIAVADEPGPMDALEVARAWAGRRAHVTLSHPRFLEVVAPGVSKGRAVRWLARRAGVPLSQVLAIGDQYNDLEMIAEVGHGVAMPSAPPAVRAVARHVARPVDEDGAAQAISELVLGRSLRPGGERVAS